MCGISCLSVYELHTRVHLQHEADGALRKARLLQAQRQEEYEKAKVSTSRLEEEQIGGGGGAAAAKQLEKRRRLEEEALQKVQCLLCRLLWALNSSHIAFKDLFCISFLFVKVGWFLTLHLFGVFKSAFFFSGSIVVNKRTSVSTSHINIYLFGYEYTHTNPHKLLFCWPIISSQFFIVNDTQTIQTLAG